MKNDYNLNKPYSITILDRRFRLIVRNVAIGFLFFILNSILSCKKFVDVDPPTKSLSTTTVFKTDADAIAAQLAVYSVLSRGSYANYCLYTGLSSDELTSYSTDQPYVNLFNNSLNAQSDGGISGTWADFYNQVYKENGIIENVSVSTGMTDAVKTLTIAEAKFGRAFLYFQLVNMFGSVPLVLTTDYTKNSILPRSTADIVYRQIIDDLLAAQGSLSSGYLDQNDNVGAPDKVRPTVWAADALLARVYLYVGDWTNAEKYASMVIANPTFTLSAINGTNSVFTKNSLEAIWQVMQQSNQLYTIDGETYILTSAPGTNGTDNAISPQLLNAFEPNDLRKKNWIGSYSEGTNTWYFPYKYKSNSSSTTTTEYTMILRLAEQFLIRAEARVQLGTNLVGGISDLNIIRSRAGLPNVTANSKSDLLAAIAHERQVELFTENARWFDLKRTKTIDAVMKLAAIQKNNIWNSYQQLYPLPVTDLQLNPNLVQNTGY